VGADQGDTSGAIDYWRISLNGSSHHPSRAVACVRRCAKQVMINEEVGNI